MKVRKYGHEPAQTNSQAKRIGNRPTLFLELFGRTDRRKPINRLQTPLLEISLSLCLNRAANQIKLCWNDLAVPLLPYTKRVDVKTERKVMGYSIATDYRRLPKDEWTEAPPLLTSETSE